jgi:AraC-like DNA-binding protein
MLENIINLSETTIYKTREIISMNLALPCMTPLRELGISACGHARTAGPFCMIRRGDSEKTHFNLCFMLEGTQLLETEDAEYIMEPGTFMSLPSWINRRFTNVGDDDLSILFMRIESDAVPVLQSEKTVIRPSIEAANIGNAFFKVHHELNNPDKYSENIARMQTELISMYLLREFRNLESPEERDMLLRFYKLWSEVRKNPAKNWTVKKMAAIMTVSPSHFYAICRKYQNISPLSKVTELRMEAAKKLLAGSNENICDIAESIGYGSEFSFAKAFKKNTGTSPGRFRRRSDAVYM